MTWRTFEVPATSATQLREPASANRSEISTGLSLSLSQCQSPSPRSADMRGRARPLGLGVEIAHITRRGGLR